MKRFFATLRLDVQLQYRYRIYAVSGFMILVWGVLLSLFPQTARLYAATLVPAFLVFNLIVTTFYFMAALILLEKDEGMLTVLVTTPLRDLEYLGSKVLTLTFVALAESLLIVVLLFGTEFHWLPLLSGTTLLGALYVCVGFITVVRYDAINAWLIPSMVVVTILVLPLLAHFGMTSPLWFYLHPCWPALRLMEAAYAPVTTGQMACVAGAAVFWPAVSLIWARQWFRRFVVRTAGMSSAG
jgi:fluoroquinolone transport system permease protein